MLEFIKEKKVIIFIVLISIILIGKNIYNSINDYNMIDENQIFVNNVVEENVVKEEVEEVKEKIIVHISGAVENPGIVKIDENSRIEDAINAAGGLKDDADITNVNLAYIVEDGIKITIPSIYDENEVVILSDDGAIGLELSDEKKSSSSALVNINKATQTELETLNGIGPSLALKIIEYREQNGKFKSIDDIKNVTGIGDTKFNNIKDQIEV